MRVFVTGSTGFMGRRLVEELIRHGHEIKALARAGSETKLPPECTRIIGNPLDRTSYQDQIAPCDTFVHLVGVAHPGPHKGELFRSVDFVSGREAILAAKAQGITHFVYLSVAQPAPIMQSYLAARADCEKLIHEQGLNATILRPWYVLGPGRMWPSILLPAYWICERIPATRPSAQRLGLITIRQLVKSLLSAVESPPHGVRIWEVPELKRAK